MAIIKIDKHQPKTIKMDINVQGIDKTKLNFHFKIELSEMTIGFIPNLVGDDKLEINIPPLSSKLVDLPPDRYIASLEIHDGEKYFLKPWSGEVVIEEEPQVTASIDEYEELDTSNINVNYVKEEEQEKKEEKPKKKETKKETPKKKKKMTKEQAVKFVREARERLANEDKNVVDKFIKETLNKYGFDFKPEREEKKQTKTKKSKKKPNPKNVKIESRNDVIEFLKNNGIRNERTLNTLMERIDYNSGDDVESMFEMANRLINPSDDKFDDPNDFYKFFQQQQMSHMNQGSPPTGSSDENMSQYNIDDNEDVSYGQADTGSKSNLMEQIQKAKTDMFSQLNTGNNNQE